MRAAGTPGGIFNGSQLYGGFAQLVSKLARVVQNVKIGLRVNY